MRSNEQTSLEKITNRHIAKLLNRLKPLNIPEIAISEIKRQMWFLSGDVQNLSENKGYENNGQKSQEENQ